MLFAKGYSPKFPPENIMGSMPILGEPQLFQLTLGLKGLLTANGQVVLQVCRGGAACKAVATWLRES